MRATRMLMIMAGITPSPAEKAVYREQRRVQRMERAGHRQIQLLDMIARRERGEEGLKPMPLAKAREDAHE